MIFISELYNHKRFISYDFYMSSKRIKLYKKME